MIMIARTLRRRPHWLLLAALLCLPACGDDDEGPLLDEVCNVTLPPPTYGDPDVEPTLEPPEPPYRRVVYKWFCVEGMLVEETWIRQENNCWIRSDEYRRDNPICPSRAP